MRRQPDYTDITPIVSYAIEALIGGDSVAGHVCAVVVCMKWLSVATLFNAAFLIGASVQQLYPGSGGWEPHLFWYCILALIGLWGISQS